MPTAIKNRGIHQTIRGNGECVQQIARLIRVVPSAKSESHPFQESMLQFIRGPDVEAVSRDILCRCADGNVVVLYHLGVLIRVSKREIPTPVQLVVAFEFNALTALRAGPQEKI